MKYKLLLLLGSLVSGQSLVNLFAPTIVDFFVSGVLRQLQRIPEYENSTFLPELIDEINDKTSNELIGILKNDRLSELSNPDNWSIQTFSQVLDVNKNLLDGAVDELLSFVPASDTEALQSLLSALVSELDELQNFLQNGWDSTELVAILFDYTNTVSQFLQLFGDNQLIGLILESVSYVLLAAEKYLRITATMADNEILANLQGLINSFSAEEFHNRSCTSLQNGLFVAVDDLVQFVVESLTDFGSDITYIVDLWNNLISDLPFDDYLVIDTQSQCKKSDVLDVALDSVEVQLRRLSSSIKLALWPMRPFTASTSSLLLSLYTGFAGRDC